MLTAPLIKRFCPSARADIVDALVQGWPDIYGAGINTPKLLAHFMAQIATETGGLSKLEENLNYSATRLVQVWPSRFRSIAAATPYAKNPKKLANKVYGGRLGNMKANDGWDYRGGGMLQTTGRANYRDAGHEDDPDALRTPGPALEAALQFWTDHDCNRAADTDSVAAVRKIVNGGSNGLSDAKAWFVRAKATFKTVQAPAMPVGIMSTAATIDQPKDPETERDGDDPASLPPVDAAADVQAAAVIDSATGQQIGIEDVEGAAAAVVAPVPVTDRDTIFYVQTRLKEIGYPEVGKTNGEGGNYTDQAVRSFKAEHDIEPVTPVIDAPFLVALATAKPREISEERANASSKEVRAVIPEVKTNWFAKIGAGFVAIFSAIWTFIMGVVDKFSDAQGYIYPIKKVATDMPGWVWIALAGGVASGLFLIARRTELQAKEAFQTGARR